MATKRADAYPAKRFFVDMLIRDIELHDAILDLLDNCVDGAMRSINATKAKATKSRATDRPYEGFFASIEFDKDKFRIFDNCGGISIDLAESYAFRMGRPDAKRDNDLPTVGVYGIGMKRAIFKIGRNTEIKSQTVKGGFSLTISQKWLESDDDWYLPITEGKKILKEAGTEILVTKLRDGIPRVLADETDFERTLKSAISAYYGYIIEKGFKVEVNGEVVNPVKAALLIDQQTFNTKEGIKPFVYQGTVDGVDVTLVVGLYRRLPSEEEENDALQGRPSSESAGWTIVCNDRVVLYADKTRVTGWGEATVPQYHTQFVSIAGIVVFKSNDASKLPITTTKRGIDGNSELYLSVKEFMREGLKLFTDFTNKWKKSLKELQSINEQLGTVSPEKALSRIPDKSWSKVMKGVGGQKFKPNLPLPKEDDPYRQIQFARRTSEIARVARYLFDDVGVAAGEVGSKCFDDVLKKAKK